VGSDGALAWSYTEAFSRHRGLLSEDDQDRLRSSRVAIAGMGGVGGIHLATLARLGVGAFHLADPDHYEAGNFNRQYGATTRTLGRSKVEVMADEARAINPEVELRLFREPIGPGNVDAFLDGVDMFIDGVDFFAIEARRLLFREARRQGIWALTAGPLGFGTAWQVFSPDGMSFDAYYDLHDRMDRLDQLIAFAVGLAPRATHLRYLDLAQVDLRTGRAPSAGLACHLASGVMAAETIKVLLGRGPLRPAPHYFQFDAYRQVLRRGRLWLGNRHPLQRLKRWFLRRRLRAMGVEDWPSGLPEGTTTRADGHEKMPGPRWPIATIDSVPTMRVLQ
jgi:molybdopterin/thiamine biosynthesis adenylyltransferase